MSKNDIITKINQSNEVILISNRVQKPKKSARELVEMLRDEKGVLFNLMTEADAENYLSVKNNYLRTAS